MKLIKNININLDIGKQMNKIRATRYWGTAVFILLGIIIANVLDPDVLAVLAQLCKG